MGQSAAGAVAGGMHGFVPALTSFVGRADVAQQVAALLERYRLVTLTGPGGSGKTRLAGEVAGRVAGRFANGVWLAELAGVRDAAQVPAAAAAALGVQEQPGRPVADSLAEVLAGQQLLLVLDNCEHVIGAAAELCARLLPAADDVRVLATSREPLRTAGEARYRLGPLTLPGPGQTGGGGSEAVALFADRARRADPRFTLDGQAATAVARLVTRLDGMPLAIELAAARVEVLGVAQLLDRVDDRLDLLTDGDRLAAGRQRSLAATVQWSYRLLTEQERKVFRAVSVFPGPFTLEAAEAVAGKEARAVVLHLVDCSLLAPPRTEPDGRSRYVMLETLRAFGDRLLAEAGEREQAAAALAEYVRGVAEQAGEGLRTGTAEQAAAWWLDAEDATVRQVLAWATEHDAVMATGLVLALAPWWLVRGRLAGEHAQLRAAASRAETGSDAWCAARFWLAWTALFSAGLDEAEAHFTAVRDAAAGRPPSPMLAECLGGRSVTLANQGRTAEATGDGRRAVGLAQAVGHPAGEALALVGLTIAALAAGEFGRAVRLAGQAGQITADIPGWIARLCGNALTAALIAAGDLGAAERNCAAGLAQARDAGDLRNLATQLTNMAVLELQAGRPADAAWHMRELLEIGTQSGSRMDVLNGLEACGYLCAATGRAADAVTVWAARAASWRHAGLAEPPKDARHRAEPLREARQALGEAQVQAAEDRGAAMSLATAAEYGLMLTTQDPPLPAPELAALSARERELVTLVAQGHTDAQIAGTLFISIRTVGSHLDRIRDKTGCRRRADLTRLALITGLV